MYVCLCVLMWRRCRERSHPWQEALHLHVAATTSATSTTTAATAATAIPKPAGWPAPALTAHRETGRWGVEQGERQSSCNDD